MKEHQPHADETENKPMAIELMAYYFALGNVSSNDKQAFTQGKTFVVSAVTGPDEFTVSRVLSSPLQTDGLVILALQNTGNMPMTFRNDAGSGLRYDNDRKRLTVVRSAPCPRKFSTYNYVLCVGKRPQSGGQDVMLPPEYHYLDEGQSFTIHTPSGTHHLTSMGCFRSPNPHEGLIVHGMIEQGPVGLVANDYSNRILNYGPSGHLQTDVVSSKRA